MTERDESLEGIFYRRMSRLVPKYFHRRIMSIFRRAVEIHRVEGNGKLLAEDVVFHKARGMGWPEVDPSSIFGTMTGRISTAMAAVRLPLFERAIAEAAQEDLTRAMANVRETAQNPAGSHPPVPTFEDIKDIKEWERLCLGHQIPLHRSVGGGITVTKGEHMPRQSMILSPDLFEQLKEATNPKDDK